MVYEENGFYVSERNSGDWVVFRPSGSGTHVISDSAYPAGEDGLSVAIARVLYLARGPGRGMASEAMRLAQAHLSGERA